MNFITPQSMFDDIVSGMRYTGTREEIVDPIKNNFWWDQQVYSRSRKFFTCAAIVAPVVGGGIACFYVNMFNTWLNPVAWPHKIVDTGLSSVSGGYWASIPLHNLWSFTIVVAIALWLLKRGKRHCCGSNGST